MVLGEEGCFFQAGPKLSFLSLQNSGIIDMYHHTWPGLFYGLVNISAYLIFR
jgi:hypothetical protein